jgi:hypothetical protein
VSILFPQLFSSRDDERLASTEISIRQEGPLKSETTETGSKRPFSTYRPRRKNSLLSENSSGSYQIRVAAEVPKEGLFYGNDAAFPRESLQFSLRADL